MQAQVRELSLAVCASTTPPSLSHLLANSSNARSTANHLPATSRCFTNHLGASNGRRQLTTIGWALVSTEDSVGSAFVCDGPLYPRFRCQLMRVIFFSIDPLITFPLLPYAPLPAHAFLFLCPFRFVVPNSPPPACILDKASSISLSAIPLLITPLSISQSIIINSPSHFAAQDLSPISVSIHCCALRGTPA